MQDKVSEEAPIAETDKSHVLAKANPIHETLTAAKSAFIRLAQMLPKGQRVPGHGGNDSDPQADDAVATVAIAPRLSRVMKEAIEITCSCARTVEGWRRTLWTNSGLASAPEESSPSEGGDQSTVPILTRLGRRPEGSERVSANPRLEAFFFWFLVGLTCAALLWLNLMTLDIASMTQGEIIPSSQVKTIQHLEGGIILEIPVREGQHVEKGQELVILESTLSSADVAELDVRLTSLLIDIKRLEAEAKGGTDVRFEAELNEKAPEVVLRAIERFQGRRRTQESRVTSQLQLISQRQNEIKEIQARLARYRETLQFQE
jgi:hypothetical protein